MARDFFDLTPEQQNVVLINTATLREAERRTRFSELVERHWYHYHLPQPTSLSPKSASLAER
jgi:hypothetical protein